MLRKMIKSAVAFISIVFAVVSLFIVVFAPMQDIFLTNADEVATGEAEVMNISENITFASMNDYIDYMQGDANQGSSGVQSATTSRGTDVFCVPTCSLSDAILESIEVTDDGVIFNYHINRSSNINISDESDVMDELLHTIRFKTYAGFYFVGNQRVFAQKLASAIGAFPVAGQNDVYQGPVYSDTSTSSFVTTPIQVGTQCVKALAYRGVNSSDGNGLIIVDPTPIPDTQYYTCYWYYPATVSEREAEELFDVQVYYRGIENDDITE